MTIAPVDFRHFIMHKPYGYMTQFIYNNKRKKKLLGELYDFPEGTMAIGRLDEHSEGLLFLTTNGKASSLVRGRKIEKEYHVQVDGIATQDAIDRMKQGVEIGVHGEKYMTLPCEAKLLDDPGYAERSRRVRDDRHGPTSWISITIKEGKYRQVRKMTAAVDIPTLRLIRYRIGNTTIQNLEPGEVNEVEAFDLGDLNLAN
jgi:23S rRNA pseudouridine2457 synthase